MKITQGTFSFLPDLTDEEIKAQVEYAIARGWACSVEHTDDPHPRNTYWEMWATPMFDVKDAAGVMVEVTACRAAFPRSYIKVNAFDSTKGVESMQLSFIVNRPPEEPGLRLLRVDGPGRAIQYSLAPYATEKPEGSRY